MGSFKCFILLLFLHLSALDCFTNRKARCYSRVALRGGGGFAVTSPSSLLCQRRSFLLIKLQSTPNNDDTLEDSAEFDKIVRVTNWITEEAPIPTLAATGDLQAGTLRGASFVIHNELIFCKLFVIIKGNSASSQ